MFISKEDLTQILQGAFPDAEISLAPVKGCDGHYMLGIVSSAFQGRNRLQRHQMIYKALGASISNLHALSIQARAPDEKEGSSGLGISGVQDYRGQC